MHVDRRLNVLVYLNEGWREEWGGALEMWDRDLRRRERRIAPHFNRTLVFLTTDYSYHGHPDPLDCPPGVTRKSVALHYYTNGRPDDEVSRENRSRGGRYVRRRGDRWTPTDLSRLFTPPLLYDAARALPVAQAAPPPAPSSRLRVDWRRRAPRGNRARGCRLWRRGRLPRPAECAG
jgi:2OG-Fe(II) oxygenase superfamily